MESTFADTTGSPDRTDQFSSDDPANTLPNRLDLHDPLNRTAHERFGLDYVYPYQRLVITNILRAARLPGFHPRPVAAGNCADASADATGAGNHTLTAVPGAGQQDEDDDFDANPHQIAILPTGAGKSLCFMLPAVLLPGITLVVFPLLSLISDQARRLEEANIHGAVLRGGQTETERRHIWKKARNGELRMLLTNPETALSPAVLKEFSSLSISHVVIDEMHTVSEWGDTFRPAYLEIGRLPREAGIPLVTAFTATASEHILNRVKEILFPEESPNIVTANPDRPNIAYRVVPSLSKNHDLTRLLMRSPESQETVQRPAIVFCNSRRSTELTAAMLRRRLGEQEIFFYHAGLEKEEKSKVEKWFFDSDDGILIATCAYGMGVDKKNVRTVIHRDLPTSVEAYLQESGRGGRDRRQAYAILLYGEEDEKRAARNDDEAARARYADMLDFAENTKRCRRETLLKALGVVPEACFGCDVCGKTVQLLPDGARIIEAFLRTFRKHLPRRIWAGMLAGSVTGTIISEGWWRSKWFGALSGWDRDELDVVLQTIEDRSTHRHNGIRRSGIAELPVWIMSSIRRIPQLLQKTNEDPAEPNTTCTSRVNRVPSRAHANNHPRFGNLPRSAHDRV